MRHRVTAVILSVDLSIDMSVDLSTSDLSDHLAERRKSKNIILVMTEYNLEEYNLE